ncbi:MAG: hypothetical protein AAFR39_08645 [Pseudomonadota bacterium]
MSTLLQILLIFKAGFIVALTAILTIKVAAVITFKVKPLLLIKMMMSSMAIGKTDIEKLRVFSIAQSTTTLPVTIFAHEVIKVQTESVTLRQYCH